MASREREGLQTAAQSSLDVGQPQGVRKTTVDVLVGGGSSGDLGSPEIIPSSSQVQEDDSRRLSASRYREDLGPTHSCSVREDAPFHQGSVARGAGQVGRSGTSQMDGHGDRDSHPADPRGARNSTSLQEVHGGSTTSPMDDPPQYGLQEEGQLAGLYDQRAEHAGESKRGDDQPDQTSNSADPHDRASLRDRSGGIRRTLCTDLRGGVPDEAQLCSLGVDHSSGGRGMLPVASAGSLARGEAEAKAYTSGFEKSSNVLSTSAGLSDQGLHRIQVRRDTYARDSVYPGNAELYDADDARVEGGSGQPEGGTPPQEGSLVRWHRELRDAMNSTSTEPEAKSCSEIDPMSRNDVEGCKKLSACKSAYLGDCATHLLTSEFGKLLSHDRLELLEIACSPDSVLSDEMCTITGRPKAAERLSLWNGCDLSTSAGVKRAIAVIDLKRPKHVWVSPICGPYSIMQNANQRTMEQCEELARKRRDALKQYVGCCIIFTYAVEKGCHATWEWSHTCQAWRLPLVQTLIGRFNPHFAVVRGCRVGLVDEKQVPIQKGWKLMTTNEHLAHTMELPCQCPKTKPHRACEGNITHKTAYYTRVFAQKVCKAMLQDQNEETLKRELAGMSTLCESFGNGAVCRCELGQKHEANLECGACQHEKLEKLWKRRQTNGVDDACAVSDHEHDPLDVVPEHVEPEAGVEGALRLSTEVIKKKLYLLHAATGHGPTRFLVQALQKRGVAKEILELAKNFVCPVCQERQRPVPRPLASLEPHPPKWATVAADLGHWEHPATRTEVQFMLAIDEGSRFRVGRVLLEGKRKLHANAQQFTESFQTNWIQYFGKPHTLRVDPDGTFRSQAVQEFCDRRQIYLDIIPGEAHWKLGICEQAIQGVKNVMTKLAEDEPGITPAEALAEATRTFRLFADPACTGTSTR